MRVLQEGGERRRARVLADLVDVGAPHALYPHRLLLASTSPSSVLGCLTQGYFERQFKEADDEQERAWALEALDEGSSTSVEYVICLTPIPQTEFSRPRAALIAVRTGSTWRDPWGQPIGEEERATARQAALTDLHTSTPV